MYHLTFLSLVTNFFSKKIYSHCGQNANILLLFYFLLHVTCFSRTRTDQHESVKLFFFCLSFYLSLMVWEAKNCIWQEKAINHLEQAVFSSHLPQNLQNYNKFKYRTSSLYSQSQEKSRNPQSFQQLLIVFYKYSICNPVFLLNVKLNRLLIML